MSPDYEDLIADRMGQFASGTARDRIDQARLLLALHPDADLVYLERPSTSSGGTDLREETMGDHGVESIGVTVTAYLTPKLRVSLPSSAPSA